jgi:hypothetical protein
MASAQAAYPQSKRAGRAASPYHHTKMDTPTRRFLLCVGLFLTKCRRQKTLRGVAMQDAQSSCVIPGRRVSGEPGIQAASMAVLAFPDSGFALTRAPE